MIILLGVIHNDLFLEQRLRVALAALKPAIITCEINETIIGLYQELRAQRMNLEKAIDLSPYSKGQKDGTKRIIINSHLPTDYIVCTQFAEMMGIPIHYIDHPSHLSSERLGEIQGLGQKWLVMEKIFREGYAEKVSELNKLLKEIERLGLQKTLTIRNAKIESYYRTFRRYFEHRFHFSPKLEIQLRLGKITGIIGARDRYESEEITKLHKPNLRLVHCGGLAHMVDIRGSLFNYLKSYSPTRKVISDY